MHRRRESDALWNALRAYLDEGTVEAIRREAAVQEASEAHRLGAEVAAQLLDQEATGVAARGAAASLAYG